MFIVADWHAGESGGEHPTESVSWILYTQKSSKHTSTCFELFYGGLLTVLYQVELHRLLLGLLLGLLLLRLLVVGLGLWRGRGRGHGVRLVPKVRGGYTP